MKLKLWLILTRKGAPIICEIGKRDVDGNKIMVKERLFINTPEGKKIVDKNDFINNVANRIEELQQHMFDAAKERLNNNVRTDITTQEDFRDYFANANEWIADGKAGKVAFVRGGWSGDENSEALLKEMKITIRTIPFDQPENMNGRMCLLTGKPAKMEVIYARSY